MNAERNDVYTLWVSVKRDFGCESVTPTARTGRPVPASCAGRRAALN